ncbi:hypothetical protein NL676_002061 [Syzygium grande]|nr:hypothetical protein NL676_002061 [Syzygium grande]
MPPIPASPITCYGVPIDFESELYQFTVPTFLFIVFVCYTATLWVDIGAPRGHTPYHFVSIFILIDERLVEPIPYPESDNSDDGGDGKE